MKEIETEIETNKIWLMISLMLFTAGILIGIVIGFHLMGG